MRILRSKNRLDLARLPDIESLFAQYSGEWVYVPKGALAERRLLAAIDEGGAPEDIARRAGVSGRTVYRRMRRSARGTS